MQWYLVVWPWGTSSSLHFFIRLILLDKTYWSLACPGLASLLSQCHLMWSRGPAALGKGSWTSVWHNVGMQGERMEQKWTQLYTVALGKRYFPPRAFISYLTNVGHKESTSLSFIDICLSIRQTLPIIPMLPQTAVWLWMSETLLQNKPEFSLAFIVPREMTLPHGPSIIVPSGS